MQLDYRKTVITYSRVGVWGITFIIWHGGMVAILFRVNYLQITSLRFMLPKPSEIFIGEKRAYTSRESRISRRSRLSDPTGAPGESSAERRAINFLSRQSFRFLFPRFSRVFDEPEKRASAKVRTMQDAR